MSQTTPFFPVGGGLDLVTPAVALKPGRAVAALNYEPVASGYRRLRGFERFDGRIAPSESLAHEVTYDDNGLGGSVTQILAGQAIRVGVTVAGTALENATLVSGTWGTSTAVGRVKLRTSPQGNASLLVDNAALFIVFSAVTVYQNGAATALTASASADLQRALIQPVPGSGPVRGVWYFDGEVVAVRNNAGGTAAVFYRSTAAGWITIANGTVMNFSSGGTLDLEQFVTGSSILPVVGATSGANGSIVRIERQSGTWAGGDAAGYMVVQVPSTPFQAENIDTAAGTLDVATVAGPGITNVLPPGGDYEFLNYNFYGASDLNRMYGVNGVGMAFYYDKPDATMAPISTGMANDKPTHIAAHRHALFLSFPGGSVQFSAVGDPTTFSPIVGAGEIAIGDEIVGFIPANQGTLAILGNTSISVLYGNDSTDYVLDTINGEAGALEHTAQRIGQVIYMDNRGLRSLSTTAAFGNFSFGALTQLIEPLLRDYRIDGVQPVASIVSRTSDQYWLFFDNETGIIVYMGGKDPVILPVSLGVTVTSACSVEVDNVERMFFGADDGYVFELNKGTSFDGENIEHYIRFPFNHFGSPQQRKRLHKVSIDLEATGTTSLSVSADLDLGAVEGIPAQALVVTTGGAAIDDLGSNELYYASQIETTAEAYLGGVARTISLKVGGSTADEQPHTLTGITYFITPRGLVR